MEQGTQNSAENPRNLSAHALEHGLILGVGMVVYYLLIYLLGFFFNWVSGLLSFVILIVGLVFFTRQYRDQVNGGELSYKEGLGLGVLISLITALILGAFYHLLYAWIDPGLLKEMLEKQREGLANWGLGEEEVDQQMEAMRTYYQPWVMALSSFFWTFILGSLIALIVPATLQKDPADDPNV